MGVLKVVQKGNGIFLFGNYEKFIGNSPCIYGLHGKFIGNSTCIYGNSWEICWE